MRALLCALLLVFVLAFPAKADVSAKAWDYNMVNALRAKHGLGMAHWDPYLQIKASRFANELAAEGGIRHGDLPCYCGHVAIGQNVGFGPSVGAIEWAFQHSPAHLANELDPAYTQLAIGTTYRDGIYYVVQDYRG